MLRERMMGMMKRMRIYCIPGLSSASSTARYDIDTTLQKITLKAMSGTSQSATASLSGTYAIPSADGKYSFEVSFSLDNMSGLPDYNYVDFDCVINKSGFSCLLRVREYQDGYYQIYVFDTSSTFPASYNSGKTLTKPSRLTFIADTDAGTYAVKLDGSPVTLSGDVSFPAGGSAFGVYIMSSTTNNIVSSYSSSMTLVTREDQILYGTGKSLCGGAI